MRIKINLEKKKLGQYWTLRNRNGKLLKKFKMVEVLKRFWIISVNVAKCLSKINKNGL